MDAFFQFRLRTVFVLTFIAVLASAALAPLVRQWTREQQIIWVAYMLGCLISCASSFVLWAGRRRHALRSAGPILLKAVGPSMIFQRLVSSLGLLFLLLGLAFLSLRLVDFSLSTTPHPVSILFMLAAWSQAFVIPVLVMALVYGMQGTTYEFGEQGVINGGWVFTPWSKIQRYTRVLNRSPSSKTADLRYFDAEKSWRVRAPKQVCEEAQRLFQRYVGESDAEAADSNGRQGVPVPSDRGIDTA